MIPEQIFVCINHKLISHIYKGGKELLTLYRIHYVSEYVESNRKTLKKGL